MQKPTNNKYTVSMMEWSQLLSGIEEEEYLKKNYTTIEDRQQLAVGCNPLVTPPSKVNI